MNVGELKKMLEKYPNDMEVIRYLYSDFQFVSRDDWKIMKGVNKGTWVMRSHDSMSEENKRQEKQYLTLEME